MSEADPIKQVLVMRTEFLDSAGGDLEVPIGKAFAQASHASMAFMTIRMRLLGEATVTNFANDIGKYKSQSAEYQQQLEQDSLIKIAQIFSGDFKWFALPVTAEEEAWLSQKFTKITLGIKTEAKLMALYKQVKEAGLTVTIITDAGDTCFNHVPTVTAIAIGPHHASKIDPFTKKLQLLKKWGKVKTDENSTL